MAIINGPYASKMRGKVGEVVAAKTTGNRTALRSYQPKVKNPNTLRQRVSRNKLAKASELAAIFANAVKAGFGFAVGGTKMYARNMFVRDLVKGSAISITPSDPSQIEVNYAELHLSARAGISLPPTLGEPSFAQPGKISVPVTAYPTTMVDKPGMMGIVVVIYVPDMELAIVKMAAAPTTGSSNILVDGLESFTGMNAHVYAFSKWIPETGNEVSTITEPWKYPSETSECAYGGNGDIS